MIGTRGYRIAAMLGLLSALASCSQGVSDQAGRSRIAATDPVIGAAGRVSSLEVQLEMAGQRQDLKSQSISTNVTKAVTRLFGPLMDNAPRTLSIPIASFPPSPNPPTATGVYQNLRPGGGYKLSVALYDAATPTNLVLAGGETATFALTAGTNTQTVTLNLVGAINVAPTLGGSNLLTSNVVTAGNLIQILPVATDPNAELRAIRLWLDGTAGSNFTDGKLLATWFPDGFASSFNWNTGLVLTPVTLGTPPTPAPAPTANAFVTPDVPTPSPSPPLVLAPAAVATPAPANHTLTFSLHDRFAAPDSDLIRVVSYKFTVAQP